MLVCFGFSWPFSIFRTWKSRSSKGKSPYFLWLIILGYLSGIIYKLNNLDVVIFAYIANLLMVSFDLVLCYRFRDKDVKIKEEIEPDPSEVEEEIVKVEPDVAVKLPGTATNAGSH
ncbi:MAG: hypothetical protein WCO98_03280 [bacterium]